MQAQNAATSPAVAHRAVIVRNSISASFFKRNVHVFLSVIIPCLFISLHRPESPLPLPMRTREKNRPETTLPLPGQAGFRGAYRGRPNQCL
jgi:hypothetical protein